MNVLDFSLADLIFRVTSEHTLLPLGTGDPFELFRRTVTTTTPDASYTVDFTLRDPSSIIAAKAPNIVWQNTLWRLRSSETDGVEIDVRDMTSSVWRTAARLSSDLSGGKLFVPVQSDQVSVRTFYHPQDRAIILGRVCHLGGVMLHASSVWINGRVLVFAGVSGSGKTTLARLFRRFGALILNDERTLIHMRDGVTHAGASPWHGEENQVHTATGPLAAIFFLRQASRNRLDPLSLSQSLGRMITAAFVPVFIPDGTARTMENCAAILERVPTYELNFGMNDEVVELCLAAPHSRDCSPNLAGAHATNGPSTST